MFYATRKLHLPQGGCVEMYVAELVCGRVVRCFPFDGERQSMLWVENLFLSAAPDAKKYSDIKNGIPADINSGQPFFLYSATLVEPLCDDTPLVAIR